MTFLVDLVFFSLILFLMVAALRASRHLVETSIAESSAANNHVESLQLQPSADRAEQFDTSDPSLAPGESDWTPEPDILAEIGRILSVERSKSTSINIESTNIQEGLVNVLSSEKRDVRKGLSTTVD